MTLKGILTILFIVAALAVVIWQFNILPEGDKPIVAAINMWSGYSGILYENGGLIASEESRFFKEYGIKVELKIIDNPESAVNAWKADEVDCYWQTVDAWTTQAGGLLGDGPWIGFYVDNSFGGDVCVATAAINTIADLRDKKIACALGAPSNTLILRMLQSAGMTVNDVTLVGVPSALEAVQYMKNGQVDAAVVWSPDDEDIMNAMPGVHRLWSTREAPEIIADIMPFKKSFVDANPEKVQKFITGWLAGNAMVNSNSAAKEEAIRLLAVAFNTPEDFFRATLDKAKLATLGDNKNFFGLEPNFRGMTGERLYNESGQLYAAAGMMSTVLPAWRLVADPSILRKITLSGPQHAAHPGPSFAPPTEEILSQKPVSTKRVSIEFATNSDVLDGMAKTQIDREIVSILRANSNVYARLDGHTDSTGSDAVNLPLSRKRAQAVKNYLVNIHGFDPDRLIVDGYGSSQPFESNATEIGRAHNRRTEIRLLPIKQ